MGGINEELGLDWVDYGARWYDGSIGRFNTIDRFAEKYYDMTPYQYGANNPIGNIDINGDSIKYANSEIQEYVESYTSQTFINRKGKVKKNNNYDSEFANVIQTLEESTFMFNFTSDGGSLDDSTLGLLESTGDGHNFNVIVPDHSGTSKSENQSFFGGRGSILSEETYHAFQVTKGEVIAVGNKFAKGKSTILGVEVDAKIWASERQMTQTSTKLNGVIIPSISGLIKNQRGNRSGVLKIITEGVTKRNDKPGGGTISVTYPPSYKNKF